MSITNQPSEWCMGFLEKLVLSRWPRNSQLLMEPKGYFLCSHKPATGPHPVPPQSSLQPHTLYCLRSMFILARHLCSYLTSDLFSWGFQTKILYAFLVPHAWYTSCPSHYPQFTYSDNMRWKVEIQSLSLYNFISINIRNNMITLKIFWMKEHRWEVHTPNSQYLSICKIKTFNTSKAYDPPKFPGMKLFVLMVIQFIAALSLQITLKVQNL
jgi:hypothetical protein